ncbi:hypothetical protein TL16_g05266 [Triparma laevis f. inornata]|uniref:PH domain-containing protein n=1 Tax=Triparma laevis f. inornata TaxID=1714386 RepID=A0A9W7AFV0_9STRA|nr:hypothetical protein TL16_g05266 [Triparma laevis f. inornata]
MVAQMANAGVDISQLEGWLEKDRQSKNVGLFTSAKQKRYFKVHCINQTNTSKVGSKTNDLAELAMCYYKTRSAKDPNGWFFLKDVTNLEESQHKITISHPVRNFILTAPTRAEHTIWITGLIKICKHARIVRDGEVVNLPGQASEDTTTGADQYPEDDPRRWSKNDEDYDSDSFRKGPKQEPKQEARETAESRALRAKKRQQRREERNKKNKVEEEEERDQRSDSYRQGGEGDMANARVARTIRGDEQDENEEEEYRGQYRGESREYREPEYDEPKVVTRKPQYEEEEKTEETMEEDEKEEEEEEEEEEEKGGEEETEQEIERRKEGQFKFGEGLGPKPEFHNKHNLEKAPKLLKSNKSNANGPEYDSDEQRKISMGETMDEMTLGDGEKGGRRLSGANSRAFGVDTPAKGALSASRGSNKSEGKEDSEHEEEAKFDAHDAREDDEEFWGVNAGHNDNSILGDRSYSNGVSFRFDSDSDDEEVDLSMEREKRREAVKKAEREEELRRREEAKDMDDDDDVEAERMAEEKQKKKKKEKVKMGAPPAGPPPGKIKMKPPSMAPPPSRSTGLTPDKNFVEDNWDDDSPSPIKSKMKARTREVEEEEEKRDPNLGGVQADANFVEEDWD